MVFNISQVKKSEKSEGGALIQGRDDGWMNTITGRHSQLILKHFLGKIHSPLSGVNGKNSSLKDEEKYTEKLQCTALFSFFVGTFIHLSYYHMSMSKHKKINVSLEFYSPYQETEIITDIAAWTQWEI